MLPLDVAQLVYGMYILTLLLHRLAPNGSNIAQWELEYLRRLRNRGSFQTGRQSQVEVSMMSRLFVAAGTGQRRRTVPDEDRAGLANGLGPHGLCPTTWEFPKIGGPNIGPQILGLLLQGHPQKGPPNFVETATWQVFSCDDNLLSLAQAPLTAHLVSAVHCF